ncbi:hypothetical protein GTW43_32300 [Streptomyces sp. SID5785]|uniref:hypothetical protein n=1 Tax=Streptomyces sp. SID5785 TaxID=2690309 RepID=UPI001361613E|nr:hypothetical protein [Streptomyces sp. SID5785]MZD09729.1 hypothetical protein [Streptomyces sp. SID5785]
MPDRSLRLTLPAGAVLRREGRPTPPSPSQQPQQPSSGEPDSSGTQDAPGSSSGSASGPGDDNPFAPPPEGTPDRPWQPRRPGGSDSSDGPDGSDGSQGQGQGGGQGRTPWGDQWSDRQPGRTPGGRFGERPGAGPGGGQGGPEGQGPGPGGMRWDPTDPVQRRARYALLSGMWGFFFALFSWPYVSLLLGALALYWGISSLRAKPRTPSPDAPAPAAPESSRQQTTAAVGGLVTGGLALALVAAMFTLKIVYADYYECRSDALTTAAEKSCEDQLPKQLRPLLGTR